MLTNAKVILVSSDETEASGLERILREHAALSCVQDFSELQAALGKDTYDALLCGWSFHKGTWLNAVKEMQKRCPSLPVIILSRKGGEQEWFEVIEAGAFDLLTVPYMEQQVLPVLEHAVVARRALVSSAVYSPSEMVN